MRTTSNIPAVPSALTTNGPVREPPSALSRATTGMGVAHLKATSRSPRPTTTKVVGMCCRPTARSIVAPNDT